MREPLLRGTRVYAPRTGFVIGRVVWCAGESGSRGWRWPARAVLLLLLLLLLLTVLLLNRNRVGMAGARERV